MSQRNLLEKLLDKTTGGTRMLANGRFTAQLMRAPRLRGDHEHGLPQGTPIKCFPVDALPGAPTEWVKGGGSYVCPVDTDWGLWFSWTGNDHLNTAVIPSVKGMNPITGQKLESLGLAQYRKKCPVHDKDFKDGLYCEDCDYRWPAQNYVCAPNILWWDGFRSGDGKVRQFVFTEDEKRDIASIIMGKENTVPAFGFAFYEPKKRREPPPRPADRTEACGGMSLTKGGGYKAKGFGGYNGLYGASSQNHTYADWTVSNNSSTADGILRSSEAKFLCSTAAPSLDDAPVTADIMPLVDKQPERAKKDVSVGAGAIIRQGLDLDPLSHEDWKVEPSALIRLYFVFPEQFREITKAGVRDLNGKMEGFLSGMPVG